MAATAAFRTDVGTHDAADPLDALAARHRQQSDADAACPCE
ncbi:hypothetical protein QFZ24_000626 [Streptomyces phaeochromogenes]|nr:hypothetical protein [Streptomyces phaeochromogenes]MDQ0946703.1 hypothetical protein [Streptomyces phaeochromogenes]